jgi:catechol 2,3-dioxygenase-like lactoylglutathione lyase family enzyme
MALHRLTTITVGVPDVDATAAFYRDFGLDEVAPARFATASGGEQLRLVASPRRRRVELGVGVDDEDDLGRIAARLRNLGVEAAHTARGLETRDPAAGVGIVVTVVPQLAQARESDPTYNGP